MSTLRDSIRQHGSKIEKVNVLGIDFHLRRMSSDEVIAMENCGKEQKGLYWALACSVVNSNGDTEFETSDEGLKEVGELFPFDVATGLMKHIDQINGFKQPADDVEGN